MAIYRLQFTDGTPAEPPTIRSAPVVRWRAGDTIPLGGTTLRVTGVRDDYADRSPALVVEDAELSAALPIGSPAVIKWGRSAGD